MGSKRIVCRLSLDFSKRGYKVYQFEMTMLIVESLKESEV